MAKNRKTRDRQNRVEICRSFSYKLNILGKYESRDFFCSQKAECWPDEAAALSHALYEFCQEQVFEGVREYKRAMAAQQTMQVAAQQAMQLTEQRKDVA